jgi:geranylgeranyl reductase
VYDVVIVGAGPAGSTLARLLAPSLRVLLVEKRTLLDWRSRSSPEKPCGGLLAPDAQAALAELGLGVPREILVGPQLFAVRTVDAASGLERHYPRSYLNVERGRFDAWLLSLAGGAEVRMGCLLRALRPGPGGVTVELDAPGRIETVRTRLVVGADGAVSRVRRLAYPDRREPPFYVAVQEWWEARHADGAFTAVFDPALTDFYAWAIPKDGRLVVGAALPPGPAARDRFDALRLTLARHGVAPGRVVRREGTLIRRPARASELVTGTGAVALAGEAAGFISPSSAEGISYALRSAAALARALEPGLEGWDRRYRAGTAGLRRSVLLKRLKSPFLYHPLLRRAVMASGIGRVDVRR